jgi:hypothetical protein
VIVGINDRHRVKSGAQVVETLSMAVESSSRYGVERHQSTSDCEYVALPFDGAYMNQPATPPNTSMEEKIS